MPFIDGILRLWHIPSDGITALRCTIRFAHGAPQECFTA